MEKPEKKLSVAKSKRQDLLFYCIAIAFPVLQFSIFYIGVNFNSFILAFQKIDVLSNKATFTIENFEVAFDRVLHSSILKSAMKNSFLSFFLIAVIGIPLGLFFSYYIAKKMPAAGAFRVILFLPSILSAIVTVTIFQAFVERAVPVYLNEYFGKKTMGLLENQVTRYATLMFYTIWISFGTNVLMYSNAMSGIDPSVIESAHLDGAVGIKEFWHITLPSIYPTLVTFIVINVANIFVNQLNLFSFYGGNAPENVQTYGYYLYKEVQSDPTGSKYPLLSALGLMLSIVAIPLTLGVKALAERLGPSED